MKKQPIHQNLNTSFVNVGALVRYLHGLQFVGSIRIELSSYEAEIIFTEASTIRAREFDHIAGRISHGEQALKRILHRSREPHGRVNVYRVTEGYAGHDDSSVFVDKSIVAGARELAGNHGGVTRRRRSRRFSGFRTGANTLMVATLSEFLRVVDEALATGNLSFPAAFRVACDGIAGEFPFLKENRKALEYHKGEIVLDTWAEVDEVASAVFAALRPIFRRLRSETKYSGIYRTALENLREVTTSRRHELVSLGLIDHIHALLDAE